MELHLEKAKLGKHNSHIILSKQENRANVEVGVYEKV